MLGTEESLGYGGCSDLTDGHSLMPSDEVVGHSQDLRVEEAASKAGWDVWVWIVQGDIAEQVVYGVVL